MIDKKIQFKPINIAILTISDSRKLNNDKSGDVLEERIKKLGHKIFSRKIVKDDISTIQQTLIEWSNNKEIDAVISTGGTGLTGRDVTPEAVINIVDKLIEGFGEMFRWISSNKIGTSALQSRALAGVKNGTYIFCLPGSPSACRDGWDEILKFQLDIRHKPCNFVEIMPRLNENESSNRKT